MKDCSTPVSLAVFMILSLVGFQFPEETVDLRLASGTTIEVAIVGGVFECVSSARVRPLGRRAAVVLQMLAPLLHALVVSLPVALGGDIREGCATPDAHLMRTAMGFHGFAGERKPHIALAQTATRFV